MYWIGTSGYNYPEWRGTFYPERFPSAKMLPFYAERFRSVEINYTFYRMPTASLLSGWAGATPDGFRFTLKAPQRITHVARLRGRGRRRRARGRGRNEVDGTCAAPCCRASETQPGGPS